MLYPDQYGDPQENVSLVNQNSHTAAQRYEAVAGWMHRWFPKKDKS